MNFEKIKPVINGKQLLDLAFRKAREKSQGKKLIGEWSQRVTQKELLKLDVIQDTLVSRLEEIIKNFPQTEKLPLFYHKLMNITLNFPYFKKSLGALNWGIHKIKFFHREYLMKIKRCREYNKKREYSHGFYGRISSLLKQINENLVYLETCRQIMRTYPDIQEMPTVCIYGFPNVGKTTLLNKLTGTQARIEAYAFTTQSINVGYLTTNNQKIQVLDVPGSLARPEKKNNIELIAELVVEELADIIIYVFDLSGYSGYGIKKQEQLFKKLSKNKKILVYLCKTDLTDTETIAQFKHKHYSLEEIKEKIFLFLLVSYIRNCEN